MPTTILSAPATTATSIQTPPTAQSTASSAAAAVKPCCVCKDEKAARDECMLYSEGDGEVKCQDMISAYKRCMAGYGFKM